jgi:hypothetical protein
VSRQHSTNSAQRSDRKPNTTPVSCASLQPLRQCQRVSFRSEWRLGQPQTAHLYCVAAVERSIIATPVGHRRGVDPKTVWTAKPRPPRLPLSASENRCTKSVELAEERLVRAADAHDVTVLFEDDSSAVVDQHTTGASVRIPRIADRDLAHGRCSRWPHTYRSRYEFRPGDGFPVAVNRKNIAIDRCPCGFHRGVVETAAGRAVGRFQLPVGQSVCELDLGCTGSRDRRRVRVRRWPGGGPSLAC